MKKKLLSMLFLGILLTGLTACSGNGSTPAVANKAVKDTEKKAAITTEELVTEELATEEPQTEEPVTEAGPDLSGYENAGDVYFLPGEFYYSDSQEIDGIGTQQIYLMNGDTLETFDVIATTPSKLAVSSGLMEGTTSGTIKDLLKLSMVSSYGENYTSSEFTGGQNRAGTEMTWSVYEYDNVDISGISVTVRYYIYVDDTDIILFMHLTPDISEFSGKFEDILRSIIISGNESEATGELYLEYYDGTRVYIQDVPGYTREYESEYDIEYASPDENITVRYEFEYGSPQEVMDYLTKFYEEDMGFTLTRNETGTFNSDSGQEYQYLLFDIETGYGVRHELHFYSALNESCTFSVEISNYADSINVDDYKYLVNSDIISY